MQIMKLILLSLQKSKPKNLKMEWIKNEWETNRYITYDKDPFICIVNSFVADDLQCKEAAHQQPLYGPCHTIFHHQQG